MRGSTFDSATFRRYCSSPQTQHLVLFQVHQYQLSVFEGSFRNEVSQSLNSLRVNQIKPRGGVRPSCLAAVTPAIWLVIGILLTGKAMENYSANKHSSANQFGASFSNDSQNSSPTVTQDGHEWFQRAGKLWGTYKTLQSYMGFGSPESVIAYAARHNLKRIKHGKYTLLRKDQVDFVTGATSNGDV